MFSSLLSLFLPFSFFFSPFFPPPLAPSSPSPRLINYSNTNDEYIYIGDGFETLRDGNYRSWNTERSSVKIET